MTDRPTTRPSRGRSPARTTLASVLSAGLALTGLAATAAPAAAADPYTFTSTENPILGDGRYSTADPAPLVVPAGAPGNDTDGDALYVYTGHDEAGPTRNDLSLIHI